MVIRCRISVVVVVVILVIVVLVVVEEENVLVVVVVVLVVVAVAAALVVVAVSPFIFKKAKKCIHSSNSVTLRPKKKPHSGSVKTDVTGNTTMVV